MIPGTLSQLIFLSDDQCSQADLLDSVSLQVFSDSAAKWLSDKVWFKCASEITCYVLNHEIRGLTK